MQKQVCWVCGEVIPQDQFYGFGRRFCEKCETEHVERYKGIVNEYAMIKNKVTFERAMRLMEKSGCEMSKYKCFARAVERHSAENPEQYRSSDEMIAAVVLLEAGYDFEMNKRIGKHIVDIFIPNLCVCLEIDGDRHKYSKKEDGQRDLEIRHKLGSKWEIVRLPTKYIEKEPWKIIEAVQSVYELKKRTREKNGGILPETYSSSVKAYYDGLGIVKRIRVP
jgi:very-short-patch-repair endonuclease